MRVQEEQSTKRDKAKHERRAEGKKHVEIKSNLINN